MTERMSRTDVPRRVTAPHALASAPVARRHTAVSAGLLPTAAPGHPR